MGQDTRTLSDLGNLGGRTAVVTGACGYLGRMFIETLLEQGADVVGIDNKTAAVSPEFTELCAAHGGSLLYETADFERENDIRRCAQNILGERSSIHVLVNNAAFVGDSANAGWTVPFEQQSMDIWRRAMEINLNAVFLLTQQLVGGLRASGSGSIINIGSIYGVCGPDLGIYAGTDMDSPAAYAASKGGLIQLTRWMATVLAPDIRANAISPGGVIRGQPESFIRRYIGKTPLRRMAVEQDFKGTLAYLASDLSAYVTGQNIMVDGGWSVY